MYLNGFKALNQGGYLKLMLFSFWMSLACSVAKADIYYSAKVFGPVINIHAIDDQGQVKKITNNNRWRDLDHDVAVNGLISFSSNRKNSNKILSKRATENFNIFIVEPGSNKLSQISQQSSQEQQPRFSPTGDKLAFIRIDRKQQSIVLYDLTTKQEKTLLSTNIIYDFAWSPNSQNIVCSSKNQHSANITVIDITSLTSKVIVNTEHKQKDKKPQQLFVAPSWSPDGKYIAYIAHPLTKKSNRTLNIVQLSTQTIQVISPTNVQVQAPITWSKNSKNLLYSALVNYQQFYDEQMHKKVYLGGMQIFSSDLHGNNQQLTQGEHLHKQPVFSPDEKHIAYLFADKLNARTLQLHSMQIDGSRVKMLGNGLAQNARLQWR